MYVKYIQIFRSLEECYDQVQCNRIYYSVLGFTNSILGVTNNILTVDNASSKASPGPSCTGWNYREVIN